MKKYLILDLGNVLVHVDFKKFYNSLRSVLGFSYEETMKNLESLMSEYNKGVISPENFYRQSCRLLKLNIDFAFFSKAWTDIFTPNQELLDFLSSAKKDNLTIILASNTDSLHYGYVKKKLGLKFIDHSFLSYLESVIKPDSAFFHKMIAKLEIDVAHSIFFDDMSENVDSALSCGIKAIVHKNNSETIAAIKNFLSGE